MTPKLEGGFLLATGVILGAGLVQLQSCVREPEPREERREERRVEQAAPEPVRVVERQDAPIPAPVPSSPKATVVAATTVLTRPVTARTTLKPAGSRLNRVPSSALARLRRGTPGLSKALAYELARGTRALERGTAYTAYSHFLQALKFDPKSTDALMGIALCHYELEQRGATKRALAKVFALDATHPEASILSGFIAQVARDSGAAVDWYQRALGRVEDDEVAGELRSVISQLQPVSSDDTTATATALAK